MLSSKNLLLSVYFDGNVEFNQWKVTNTCLCIRRCWSRVCSVQDIMCKTGKVLKTYLRNITVCDSVTCPVVWSGLLQVRLGRVGEQQNVTMLTTSGCHSFCSCSHCCLRHHMQSGATGREVWCVDHWQGSEMKSMVLTGTNSGPWHATLLPDSIRCISGLRVFMCASCWICWTLSPTCSSPTFYSAETSTSMGCRWVSMAWRWVKM